MWHTPRVNLDDRTRLILENQDRFHALGNTISTDVEKEILLQNNIQQVGGHPISTFSLHMMTDVVPFGWNEPYILRANNRIIDQESIINEVEDDNMQTGQCYDIDQQQLMLDAQMNVSNQRNQQGSFQLFAYELHTRNDETLAESVIGSPAIVPVDHPDISITTRAMILYKGAIAHSVSKKAVNAMAVAMGVHTRNTMVPYRNGVVVFQELMKPFDEPESNGTNVHTLNNICRKMCLPWRYNIDAKCAHCVRHLHAYFRLITNITWTAVEGGQK